MKFQNIHHVALICSSYEISKRFYSEVLGFQILRETYREARRSYKLDLKVNETTQLELFSFPEPPKRPTNPEACGLRHLAFSVDEIESVIQELNLKGIETEPIRVDEFTGKKFTFFRDPDQLPIEIYEIRSIL